MLVISTRKLGDFVFGANDDVHLVVQSLTQKMATSITGCVCKIRCKSTTEGNLEPFHDEDGGTHSCSGEGRGGGGCYSTPGLP